jgi:hypothetical protein
MKARKYTNVHVIDDVYVDSDQTYHYTIQCDIWGKRTYNNSCLEYQFGTGFDNLSNAPLYLKQEVKTRILETLQSPNTRFYEKDRDGWKRYTGFRYHDAESLARQIEWLSESLARMQS